MIAIRGKGAFAGVSIDSPYFCRKDFIIADNHAEWLRFLGTQVVAMKQPEVREFLERIWGRCPLLFEVYQMEEELDYVEVIEAVITQEKENGVSSDTAVEFAAMCFAMDNSHMQTLAAGVKDVSSRILTILSSAGQGGGCHRCACTAGGRRSCPLRNYLVGQIQDLGMLWQRVSAPATSPALTHVMGIPTIVGIESILIPEYKGDSYTRP